WLRTRVQDTRSASHSANPEALLVLCNFGATDCPFALSSELLCDHADLLLGNYAVDASNLAQRLRAFNLRPYEGMLLRLRGE
ncbi:MAG: hypothetical protein ORN29_09685, partial [Rhodoferax sp.]|nr:hypothetical protein [Rhodoferax sp.]